MKFKKLSTALAIAMCVGMLSTTAFAFANETQDTKVPEEQAESIPEQTMEPLTPDGNLTLVDDEGKTQGEGKQFITVVTKTGNYFYIIIDRDDKGEQTVHFLNQVDEADLMKLMDEEEIEMFRPIVEEPEPEPEPEPIPVEPEPEKKPSMFPAVLTLFLFAGIGGFFAYKKWQEKQAQQEQEKPDPDADYMDDEDYGYQESEDDRKEDNLIGNDDTIV